MKGQGIIEAVYSIGILGLTLTGVVILILLSLGAKKNDFDRKKAVEMGSLVLEEQIVKSKQDTANFWLLQNVTNGVLTGFDNYTYSTTFTNITGNATYPSCGVGTNKCAELKITVNWLGKNPQSIIVNRFFSTNGY